VTTLSSSNGALLNVLRVQVGIKTGCYLSIHQLVTPLLVLPWNWSRYDSLRWSHV